MFRKCIFAAMLICAPTFAQAFDVTNWYLRGLVGPNFLSIPEFPEFSVDSNAGYAVEGAMGYKFSPTFRLEGELTYRHNELNSVTFNAEEASIKLALDGHISSFAYMANAILDLPVHPTIVPYLGFGLGGFREWGKDMIPALSYEQHRFQRDDATYQFIAGLNLLHRKRIDAGIEYHFFDSISNDGITNHTLAFSCHTTF